MKKLSDILDTELSTTIRYQKGEAVGVTIYGLDRVSDKVKDLMLEPLDRIIDLCNDKRILEIDTIKAFVEAERELVDKL